MRQDLNKFRKLSDTIGFWGKLGSSLMILRVVRLIDSASKGCLAYNISYTMQPKAQTSTAFVKEPSPTKNSGAM